jgi:hypothetical protein
MHYHLVSHEPVFTKTVPYDDDTSETFGWRKQPFVYVNYDEFLIWRAGHDFLDDLKTDALAAVAAAEGVCPAAGLEPDAGFAPRLDEVAFQAAYLPAGRALFRIYRLPDSCGFGLHVRPTFALFQTRWRAFFADEFQAETTRFRDGWIRAAMTGGG